MTHDRLGRDDFSYADTASPLAFDRAPDIETAYAAACEPRPFNRLCDTDECILLLSFDGHVREFNKAAVEALEIGAPSVLVGWLWEDLWPSNMRPKVGAAIRAAQAGAAGRFIAPSITARGMELWWNVLVSFRSPDDGGEPLLAVVFSDITSQRASRRRLRWLATHDDLTGLPNRRLFREELHQVLELAQSNDYPFALALFSISDLKSVNARLGRDVGDLVLRTFTERLKNHAGDQNAAARPGGDKFALIVSDFTKRRIPTQVMDVLIPRLCTPFLIGSQLVACTVNSGIAICPDQASSAGDLYRRADTALEIAKNRRLA